MVVWEGLKCRPRPHPDQESLVAPAVQPIERHQAAKGNRARMNRLGGLGDELPENRRNAIRRDDEVGARGLPIGEIQGRIVVGLLDPHTGGR